MTQKPFLAKPLDPCCSSRRPPMQRSMPTPVDALRWLVGTALIYAEWRVYSTPTLRRSTTLSVMWYLVCAALMSPFLLAWAPLEALGILWLRCAGAPQQATLPQPGTSGRLGRRSGRSPSRSPAASARRRVTPTTGTLRVASYNIQSGVGSDMRCDLPRIARALVRLGPLDLVALQEIDVTTTEDQVAEIARLAGFAHHAFVGTRASSLGWNISHSLLKIFFKFPYELPRQTTYKLDRRAVF